MRLSFKIALGFVVGMGVLLFFHGVSRVRYAVALLENTAKRDHTAVGHRLATMVADVWRRDGKSFALALVDKVNRERAKVSIRWISLEPTTTEFHRPRLDRRDLESVAQGKDLLLIKETGSGDRVLHAYIPVQTGGPAVGAIELVDPLEDERHYIHNIIVRTILIGLLIAGLSAVLALGLGYLMVGRPIRTLIEKARRVGSGDFSGPLALRQRDEIAVLATEMNLMSDQLAAAVASRVAAVEQLRHADRLRTVGQLASGIAHELGTPLNVIAGRGKMIARGELSGDEVADSARIIGEQAERMDKIIRNLLDFARRRSPQKRRCSLREAAEKAMTLLAPLAKKRNVSMQVATPVEPLEAEIDSEQIEQVLTNLMINGIDAMPRGGELSIKLGTRHLQPPSDVGDSEGEFACIDVCDQGTGIRPEDISRIFEPFFTTKEVGAGTGLGLSVSHGIVREHGGWIVVESDAQRGSRFSVCLPQGART